MFDSTTLRSLGTKLAIGAALVASLAVTACGSSTPTSGGTSATCPSATAINGAGSTFDNLLFTQAFGNYANAKCGIKVNYQSVGSGAGVTALLNATVQFGASDVPMTDAQLAQSTHGTIIHIPVTMGGVAIGYNLSGLPSGAVLQFKGKTLADIFLGKVTNWNDPEIAADNSGVTLPSVAIQVIHRSDGSGTTGIFTNYLAAVSTDWASGPKAGTTINWPTGTGAKGSDGVASAIKNTAGAIGYVELGYASQNGITYGSVQNHDGTGYIVPSVATVTAAAASATSIPDDLRFLIVNEPGANAYPISGFSWVVTYQTQPDAAKGQALAQALWYLVHTGQQFAAPNYAPLPTAIVTKDEAQIQKLQCSSSACFTSFIS